MIHQVDLQFANGDSGEGVEDSAVLWLELRRRTGNEPRLQTLPWSFFKNSTRRMQDEGLLLHAEKKALAVLFACGEAQLNVLINFNACIDCHEFFKSASLLFGRTIRLSQIRKIHTLSNGRCSCKDSWRWEARLASVSQSTQLE